MLGGASAAVQKRRKNVALSLMILSHQIVTRTATHAAVFGWVVALSSGGVESMGEWEWPHRQLKFYGPRFSILPGPPTPRRLGQLISRCVCWYIKRQ